MADRKTNILLIEDNPADSRLIEDYLKEVEDFRFTLLLADDLSTGLDHISKKDLDIVLVDLGLPDSQGIATVEKVLKKETGLPIIVLTGLDDIEKIKGALYEGIQDYLIKGQFDGRILVKSIVFSIERKKSEEEIKNSYQKLQKTLKSTIDTLASIVEIRDPYTSGHQKKVTTLSIAIAEELGLSNDKIEAISTAAIIHDIGKINIPPSILARPGKISDLEYTMIKTHPQLGYEMIKGIEFPWPIADIILQHHERLNSSGYPNGLKDKDILLEAKIIAVSDVVEAMSSYRPYRPALGIGEALKEIKKNKGKFYDPGVVDVCIRLFKKKGFKFD